MPLPEAPNVQTLWSAFATAAISGDAPPVTGQDGRVADASAASGGSAWLPL